MQADCVVRSLDVLGEGPCWAASEGRLYWFDIKGATLGWYEPANGRHGRWSLPMRASAAAPAAPHGLIAATERGLAHVDTRSGALKLVEPLDLGPGFRSNDGKIDPVGRFWWSRMDDNGGERPGSVYRTDAEGVTRVVLEGVHIPNTLTCNPNGDVLYLADSKRQALHAYSLDPDGLPGPSQLVADLAGTDVTPDGSALDEHGFLWNAQWGGWRIVRYAPDGRVDRVVELPVEQPTSCAFGGADLDILFVTSAREGLSKSALDAQPLAGGLFALRPGVRGLASPAFEGWRSRIG